MRRYRWKRMAYSVVLFFIPLLVWGCAIENQQQPIGPQVPQKALKIERVICTPKEIKPGKELEVLADFVVSPPGEVKTWLVRESWTVKKEEQEIETVMEKVKERERGIHQAGGTVVLPRKFKRGSYAVVYMIKACTPGKDDECFQEAGECVFEVIR